MNARDPLARRVIETVISLRSGGIVFKINRIPFFIFAFYFSSSSPAGADSSTCSKARLRSDVDLYEPGHLNSEHSEKLKRDSCADIEINMSKEAKHYPKGPPIAKETFLYGV